MIVLHGPKKPVDQWPKELSLPPPLFLKPPSCAAHRLVWEALAQRNEAKNKLVYRYQDM